RRFMEETDQRELDRAITEKFSSFRAREEWRPNVDCNLARLKQREAAIVSKRRGAMFIAFSAMVCVPLLAFPVTRAFGDRLVSACVQEASRLRVLLLGDESGPPPSSTFVKRADRKPAADFPVRDATGKLVRLSDFRGKAVLLNFWATWSEPSK